MAEEQASQETQAGKKPNKLIVIAGIVLGVLVLEGAGVFLAVKLVSKGPADIVAEELSEETQKELAPKGHENEEVVEVLIAKLECPHTNTGRLYVIDMTVYATIPKSLVEDESSGAEDPSGHGGSHSSEASNDNNGIRKIIEENIATIKDRMRTVIASADPSTLCLARAEKPDYGLVTLRRQFKAILEDVLGKGVVKDVLISDFMPRPLD